jgi:hypothetical protein
MGAFIFHNFEKFVGRFSVIFTVVISISFFLPANSLAGEVTLEWDLNSEPDIAGYVLYWGTTSRSYSDSVDVGNQNSYTVSGLEDGRTYYFAVTAYDGVRNESTYSNEVYMVVPAIDSDADGLSDADEISIYSTDPLNADTDGDGAADGLEVAYGSDPLDVLSIPYCAADFDHDGEVNDTDMMFFMAKYGGAICSNSCDGDFDRDGDVDGGDLTLIVKSCGTSGCL